MINKRLIHERFAKNLKNYNDNAKIQKRMAERLMTSVRNHSPKKILEIGCGTGFLTKLLSENLCFESFVALDIVEDCEDYIHNINSNIKFTSADIEEFLKDNNETFDLIISNASLQWVENFETVVNSLKKILNPNGELIISTFGTENFKEIYHVIGKSLKYFSVNELQAMFPQSFIDQEIHIMAFNTPKDVLKHLKSTGVNSIEQTSWTKKDLTKFENSYKNLCNLRPTLTYNPIYIKITK